MTLDPLPEVYVPTLPEPHAAVDTPTTTGSGGGSNSGKSVTLAYGVDEVRLVVNGGSKTGWQRAVIVRGIELMPSTFTVQVTDRYAGDSQQVDMKAGDTCQVYIGSDLVLTGRIDRVRRKIGRQGNIIQIVGRSNCRELVDCSVDPAQVPGLQISQDTVLAISKKLAGINGITVQALSGVGDTVIPQFNVNLGERAFPIIEGMARWAQLLVYDEVDGTLNLAPVAVGTMASGFTEGVNIEEADGEEGMDQRYSIYELYLSSTYSLTDVVDTPPPLTQVKDDTVVPARKLVIICEQHQLDPKITQQRGEWERARRYGRSNVIRLTTDSWRDKAGTLWHVNCLVDVNIPHLKVTAVQWLIAQVAFRRDETGTHADLVLMPKEAFMPEPIVLVQSDPEVANARAASSSAGISQAAPSPLASQSAGANFNPRAGDSAGV